MQTPDIIDIMAGTRERMIRELASDLADMVESGDMTEEEANEWLVHKQDQWAAEDRFL